MTHVAYARYVALKNNDAECVGAPKGGPKEGKGKGKTPERECLKKALRGLCDDVISSGTLDEIYDARNELFHEASWGRAVSYVDVLEGCARRVEEMLEDARKLLGNS